MVDTDLPGNRSAPIGEPRHNRRGGRIAIGTGGRKRIGMGGRIGIGISGRNQIGIGGRIASDSAFWGAVEEVRSWTETQVWSEEGRYVLSRLGRGYSTWRDRPSLVGGPLISYSSKKHFFSSIGSFMPLIGESTWSRCRLQRCALKRHHRRGAVVH